MKTNAIWVIALAIALIIMSTDKINATNINPSSSGVNKIVWDILGVIFIIGAVVAIWKAGKALVA